MLKPELGSRRNFFYLFKITPIPTLSIQNYPTPTPTPPV